MASADITTLFKSIQIHARTADLLDSKARKQLVADATALIAAVQPAHERVLRIVNHEVSKSTLPEW